MIRTNNFSRTFGKEKFQAVKDVSLDVADGEIYGLLGPNGAGKTTLIRMLSALITPSMGEATVNGYDVRKDKNNVRRSIGLLTETPQLYEDLTARENLEYIASFYHLPPEKTGEAITKYLEEFGLAHLDRSVSKYSKGMKQKVALARCLIHDPPVLFLDEPTSGLDPVSAKKIKDEIKNLKKTGRAIIICTHNLYDATVLCDRISIMDHEILYTGKTPASTADLEELYCKKLEEHGHGL